MPLCKKIRGQKRQICIGDMDKLITLQIRDIKPPGTLDAANQFYFTEGFSNTVNPTVYARVKTVRGRTAFDNTNTERTVTHDIGLYFDAEITAEIWIDFEGTRLDIITVENLDNRSEFMLLECTDRGLSSNFNNDL